ncbi:MAG: CPBP family glutamic-type intramembrane protease [Candidatus Daviesbacteria bacterium]|nr:CPBP family glutamic-type intramembrane protease [Candidatus Daviesbacteria bacterium]
MKEIDRRTALKICGAFAAGVVTGSISPDISIRINKQVGTVTGLPVGNAGILRQVEEACKDYPDQDNCIQNIQLSPVSKVLGVSLNPFAEEVAFRATPSIVLSVVEGNTDQLGADILCGLNDGYGLSRREFITGAISSLLFGTSHNITNNGIDLKTIPASQTVCGFAYWYLQRKFGLVSNTIAHALHNFNVIYR